MLDSIGLFVLCTFFSICLIGLLLVGFDFHFCRDFLFLKKEQSWMGGEGKNIKILYENNFNKNILKMSC